LRIKKIIKYGLVLLIIILFIFISINLKKHPVNKDISSIKSDGIGMKYYSFDKENRKGIEVNCLESKRLEKNRLFLKGINAKILRRGDSENDINIESEKGYVSNDYHDFELMGKTRIYSKDFDLLSNYFYFKNRNRLESKKLVDYKTEKIKGRALEGMLYFVKVSKIRFFKTSGIFYKDDDEFNYKADELRFVKKDKVISLVNNAEIKGKRLYLKSKKINFKFDNEIKKLIRIKTLKKTYFEIKDKDGYKKINSNLSTAELNENQKLKSVLFENNVEMEILNKDDILKISTKKLILNFDENTEKINKINIPVKSVLTLKGKNNIYLKSSKHLNILLNNKGEIDKLNALGSIDFEYNDIKGITSILNYDLEKKQLNISGNRTKLIMKNGEFKSQSFVIYTDKQIIKSNNPVTSIINFKKKNIIFQNSPIYINSDGIEINKKDNITKFITNVKLIQNETMINTDELKSYENNNMILNGKSSFDFKDNENEIKVRGETIEFLPKEYKIKIKNNGMIKNDNKNLKANDIVINFNKKSSSIDTIIAKDNVRFNKDELSGNSDIINWLFSKELVVFKGNPEITNENKSKTKGDILKLDLKTDKIEILSKSIKKTETTID